jgi:hypothetical protein
LEDVKKPQLVARRVLVGALISACFIVSISFAATQGTIGRTSVGSVSISVTIPETVQFFVKNVRKPIQSADDYVCLSVLDRNSAKSFNYYRIEDSNNLSMLLRLKNYHEIPNKKISGCGPEERIVYAREVANSKVTVLMFVPE